MLTSSHIRLLVWADRPLASVALAIDGVPHPHAAEYRGHETGGSSADFVKTPLWVAPWNASQYDDGRVHWLEATATDADGKTTTTRLPFHFSSTPIPLDNDARGGWIMRQDFAAIFRTSAVASYLLMAVFLLIVPRLWANHLPAADVRAWLAARRLEHHKDDARMRHVWAAFTRGDIVNPLVLLKLLLALVATHMRFCVSTQFTAQVYFATVPWLFWPAYFFAMGLATLPLFTGRLIPSASPADAMGSVYIYGIYIAGEWSPLLDSWGYGLTSIAALSLLLLYLPVAASSWSVFYATGRLATSCRPWYRSLAVRLAMALFILVYLGVPSLMTLYTYGFPSVLLGYGRAWLFLAAAAALYVLDWRYPVRLVSPPQSPVRVQAYAPVPTIAEQ
ncbi:hypothetical protein GGI05_005376 [Coemansia sp. RSA 2603]|nr:hypothetical protein GGI05_005376 [Coemansia sp. RSA 2603]